MEPHPQKSKMSTTLENSSPALDSNAGIELEGRENGSAPSSHIGGLREDPAFASPASGKEDAPRDLWEEEEYRRTSSYVDILESKNLEIDQAWMNIQVWYVL